MKSICASLVASLFVQDFISSFTFLAMIETSSSKDVVLVIMTGIMVELKEQGESLGFDVVLLFGEENSNSSLYS
jgi:hypothetical protein